MTIISSINVNPSINLRIGLLLSGFVLEPERAAGTTGQTRLEALYISTAYGSRAFGEQQDGLRCGTAFFQSRDAVLRCRI